MVFGQKSLTYSIQISDGISRHLNATISLTLSHRHTSMIDLNLYGK